MSAWALSLRVIKAFSEPEIEEYNMPVIGCDLEIAAYQENMNGIRDIVIGDDATWDQDDLNKALHAAVRKDNTEIVEFLLQHGASVNFRDKFAKNTALMIALKNSCPSSMRLLLKYGSELDARDKFGDTPLILCLKNQNQSGANILIKCGADTTVKDKRGNTCLYLAAEGDCAEVVDYLVKMGDATGDLNKALHAAVHRNNTEMVEFLLQHGASVKYRDNFAESTALMIASKNSCHSTMSLLLKYGSELEAKDEFGDTPLILCLENQNQTGANMLIEYGADTPVTNKQGHTCLHLAADGGCAEAVDYFIKRGVDLNAVDKRFNSTALHKAVDKCKTDIVGSNHLHIINSFLDANCDTSIQTHEGYTALLLALTSEFPTFKNTGTFQRLLRKTRNLEAANNQGLNALMAASCGGYTDCVKTLIHRGCNVYSKCHEGWTALKYAAAIGHIDAVRLLLHHGADPNSKDDEGISIMKEVLQHSIDDDNYLVGNLIDVLLRYGCILNFTSINMDEFVNFISQLDEPVNLIEQMYNYGSCQPTDLVYLAASKLQLICKQNGQSVTRLETIFSSPTSLLYICRKTIRKSIPTITRVQKLPIPRELKSFIMCDEESTYEFMDVKTNCEMETHKPTEDKTNCAIEKKKSTEHVCCNLF